MLNSFWVADFFAAVTYSCLLFSHGRCSAIPAVAELLFSASRITQKLLMDI